MRTDGQAADWRNRWLVHKIAWPANVERIEHLPPAEFYASMAWRLNIIRADVVHVGYSPSVRLIEATACGVPVITEPWPGLDDTFAPGTQTLVA